MAGTRAASKRQKVCAQLNTKDKVALNRANGTTMNKQRSFLETFPLEIQELIFDEISEKKTLAALCRTCRALYPRAMPRLHRRVIVSAMHFGQIPGMIQTVEPYLTIHQRRDLRKLGKYKGQQETYPAGVDENKVPDCAGFVEELVIGDTNPGKKHDKIAHRYIEEFVKNVTNVRIVEAEMLTTFIARSIASWKQLVALKVRVRHLSTESASYFLGVRGLKHLSICDSSYLKEHHHIIQSLVWNSARSLKTLHLSHGGMYAGRYPLFTLEGRPEPADFGALQTIDVGSTLVREDNVEPMLKAIDFTRLEAIALDDITGPASHLFRPLATLFNKASQPGGSGVRLRRLLMDARYHYEHPHISDHENQDIVHAAWFDFLSSFSGLESLNLTGYGMYLREYPIAEEGLPDSAIEAILKHTRLQTLKITNPSGTTYRILYPSPANFHALFRGLPELEHIEFCPDEWNMDRISPCLTQGNLSSITCNMYELRWIHDKKDPRYMTHIDMLRPIIKAYLDYSGPGRWEDKVNKLKTITISKKQWQISAEKFNKKHKTTKKILKAAQQMTSDDGKRTIWFREVALPQDAYIGYNSLLPWLTEVNSNM